MSVPLAVKADEWNKETRLTFNKPVEIPGMVLGPGTYVFKLADAVDRNVVQIYNAEETHLYENVLAIPAYRPEPTEKTEVTFEERAQGSPQAVKEWFYPGNYYGEEFVYPAAQTAKVAQKFAPPATEQHVTPAAPQQQTAAAKAPEPAPQNEPVQQIAQAAPPSQPAATSPAPAQKAPKKLPRTASSVPLLALIGLLSLGGSAGVRVFSKRSI